ncbi:UPF0317 protein, mitochondrial [Liparis tanakae]|uniref:UPF0317 protein, mitochondrial n=1 Tax=Liparis tanakae TaxID=230148 RepID=A0A4Z2HAG1_9TELE|nr:UPF0317 protein, mitochondrial [Liparis tanakae]
MQGYQQANVVILPRHLADDFEVFCRRNPAPLPLLYRSQAGQTSCPPLARDADIRTDISQYYVYEEGCLVKTVSSLQFYSTQQSAPRTASGQQAAHHNPWSDMICFYLGCSFGFEDRLKKAGVPVRNVEQGTNVSMYRDLSRPDYGEQVQLQPGDVPVFWACGVTAIEAIINSKPSLAFSHSPGCMFLTDIPDSCSSSPTPPPSESPVGSPSMDHSLELIPFCFLVSHNPLLYSLASQRAVAKIRKLATIIGEDPGQRGIQALFVQDELLRSCLALSHACSVAITTGFPTHYMHSPPDETDGPPGAIAMATMLLSLGKQVTMVTDRRAFEMNQALINEAVRTGVLKTAIPLVTFEASSPDSPLHFLCHDGDPSKPRYDHLVAIERTGRARDGNYYNMRGINIKHLVDPIDDLFIAAKNIPGIVTTGVGDGGNELGMGKLKDKVEELMPKGGLIACVVPADYAITAGVSNWGGYAVACGLYLLHTCPSHQRYRKKGLGFEPSIPQEELQDWTANLPSVDKEESILSTLVRFGIRSGKTGNLAMEVDGLTFHPTHSDIITRLLEVTRGSTTTSL